jgi:hypothetical protein
MKRQDFPLILPIEIARKVADVQLVPPEFVETVEETWKSKPHNY